MAKGTATGESLVVSQVRTGCKRELQFVLKSQSEICGGESLGRTRASKNSYSDSRSTDLKKKQCLRRSGLKSGIKKMRLVKDEEEEVESVVVISGTVEEEEEEEEEESESQCLLPPRKGGMSTSSDKIKRTVQWNDNKGDNLAEVLVYEPSEVSDAEDAEDDDSDSCICTIM